MSKFTPTEDLVLEVLAARLRCGEEQWTFLSAHGATLRKLEIRDLVTMKIGVVQGTYLASLTELGKTEILSSIYIPPKDKTIMSVISSLMFNHTCAVCAVRDGTYYFKGTASPRCESCVVESLSKRGRLVWALTKTIQKLIASKR